MPRKKPETIAVHLTERELYAIKEAWGGAYQFGMDEADATKEERSAIGKITDAWSQIYRAPKHKGPQS